MKRRNFLAVAFASLAGAVTGWGRKWKADLTPVHRLAQDGRLVRCRLSEIKTGDKFTMGHDWCKGKIFTAAEDARIEMCEDDPTLLTWGIAAYLPDTEPI